MSVDNDTLALFEIVQQDVAHLERRLSEVTSRQQQTFRKFKLDEKEQQIDEQDERNFLVSSMAQIANNLSEITRVSKIQAYDNTQDTTTFIKEERRIKTNDRNKRLRVIDYLSGLDKKVVAECPCGKHKGIAFKDKRKTVDLRCPAVWWREMFQIKFRDGDGRKFLDDYPYDKYMEKFKKDDRN